MAADSLAADLPDVELAASAPIKVRSSGKLKTVKRRLYKVKGKSGVEFIASQDSKGRIYMMDQRGNLFYDSGMSQIGWYMVCQPTTIMC